jgi:hypothetical protein
MSERATPLQILEDVKFDVFFGEAHLVAAEGVQRALRIGLQQIALEDLRSARERLDQAQRRIEDELFSRGQEEFEL